MMGKATGESLVTMLCRMGTFEAIIEELQSMGQAGPLDQLDAAKLADDIFNKGEGPPLPLTFVFHPPQ